MIASFLSDHDIASAIGEALSRPQAVCAMQQRISFHSRRFCSKFNGILKYDGKQIS
jgi:hypothetical protein